MPDNNPKIQGGYTTTKELSMEDTKKDWTIDALYDHFHKVLEEADKRYDQYFKSLEKLMGAADKLYQERFNIQEENVERASIALAARLEGMNEFRQQLNIQAASFIPRLEIEQRFKDTRAELEQRFISMDAKLDETNDTVENHIKTIVPRVEHERITAIARETTEARNTSIDARLSGIEKFQNEQTRTFMPRAEAEQRFKEQDKSRETLEESTNVKLEQMNTLREALARHPADYIPRAEAEQRYTALGERMDIGFEAVTEKLEIAVKNLTALADSHFNSNAERIGKLETWQAERGGYFALGDKKTNMNIQWIAIIVSILVAIGTIAQAFYLMIHR